MTALTALANDTYAPPLHLNGFFLFSVFFCTERFCMVSWHFHLPYGSFQTKLLSMAAFLVESVAFTPHLPSFGRTCLPRLPVSLCDFHPSLIIKHASSMDQSWKVHSYVSFSVSNTKQKTKTNTTRAVIISLFRAPSPATAVLVQVPDFFFNSHKKLFFSGDAYRVPPGRSLPPAKMCVQGQLLVKCGFSGSWGWCNHEID